MPNLSEIIKLAHDAARAAIKAMHPSLRGRLAKMGPHAETHFYSWLRGNDSAIAAPIIDEILAKTGLSFAMYDSSIHCGIGVGAAHAWGLVDWQKSNPEISKMIGASSGAVWTARKKFAPETMTNKRTTHDWMAVDWTKTTTEIAQSLGISAPHVSLMRRKMSPETVAKEKRPRKYDFSETDWSMRDTQIAKIAGASNERVRQIRKAKGLPPSGKNDQNRPQNIPPTA